MATTMPAENKQELRQEERSETVGAFASRKQLRDAQTKRRSAGAQETYDQSVVSVSPELLRF
jgi:hypothetical protein